MIDSKKPLCNDFAMLERYIIETLSNDSNGNPVWKMIDECSITLTENIVCDKSNAQNSFLIFS